MTLCAKSSLESGNSSRNLLTHISHWCHLCAGSQKISSGPFLWRLCLFTGTLQSAAKKRLFSWARFDDPGEALLLRRSAYGRLSTLSSQISRYFSNLWIGSPFGSSGPGWFHWIYLSCYPERAAPATISRRSIQHSLPFRRDGNALKCPYPMRLRPFYP